MPSTRHPPTQTGYPDGGPGRRTAPDGSGGVAPKYRFRTHAELDRLLTSPEDPPPAWASSLSKVELGHERVVTRQFCRKTCSPALPLLPAVSSPRGRPR